MTRNPRAALATSPRLARRSSASFAAAGDTPSDCRISAGESVIDISVHNGENGRMARPREFDREEALERATGVFWAQGYASTSTDDLLTAMGIGRQSLYNAFQDKRALYLEALERYQRTTTAGHLRRLNGAASPIAGVQALLLGLISNNDDIRALGCMGVGAVCEFGSTDPEIAALRTKVSPALRSRLTERLKEGQAAGEIDRSLDCATAASFIQLTMQSIQLAARGGIDATSLRAQARFVVERLKSR
jgi:TetR/AcrR family transcriptional repressor of nem operon